jgi:hypothetical protein
MFVSQQASWLIRIFEPTDPHWHLAAQKSWRRLDGHNQLPKLVLGVTFADGIEVHRQADPPSAHNRRRLTGPAVTKIWR